MALGSNNSYDNNKKDYHPTVYSNYKMNNAASSVDPTSIGFTFWKSMLKVSIAPKLASSSVEEPKFDYDNAATIYLNHTKARILAQEIRNFLSDPIKYNSVGVPSGQGLITISNGSEFGADGFFAIIRKINSAGQIESSYAYEFKRDYHYAIRGYDEKTNEFEKHTDSYNSIELEQFVCLLESYYQSMTGAVAYSVIDQSKYSNTYLTNKIDAIAESLGVQVKKGGQQRGQRNQSFFNSNNGNTKSVNYTQSTIEDIESNFED